MGRYIMALDQGTTSSRCILFDKKGNIISKSSKEYEQIYPKEGWVEHNPMEIWSSQLGVAIEAMAMVNVPADDIEARQAVKAAYKYEGPVYLRFGRLAVPVFHNDDYKFEIGKGEVIKEGNDVSIIANGLMVNEAIEAGKALEAKGINAEIINIATIKPLDEELVIASAKKTGKVITVEEHNIIGGLGEAVCACLSENCPTPVKRIGVNDEFGHSGPALDLLKQFGLSAEHIAEVAEEFVK